MIDWWEIPLIFVVVKIDTDEYTIIDYTGGFDTRNMRITDT